jgi:hypothetical protein
VNDAGLRPRHSLTLLALTVFVIALLLCEHKLLAA